MVGGYLTESNSFGGEGLLKCCDTGTGQFREIALPDRDSKK